MTSDVTHTVDCDSLAPCSCGAYTASAAPPAAGETVEDIECEDREFLAALGATGETPSDQPHLSGSNNIGPLQHPAPYGETPPPASPVVSCEICGVPTRYPMVRCTSHLQDTGPSTVASSIWTFSVEDYEAFAATLDAYQDTYEQEAAMLREAAALRREVVCLEEIVAAKDMAFDCANENVLAAEREVARLTHEKNDQSSSDPRRIAPPITGTGTDEA